MIFTQESFWYEFNAQIPPLGVITDLDIPPVGRNIELQGWWAVQDDQDLNILCSLLLKEVGSAREKLVCPTRFDDSASTATTNIYVRPSYQANPYIPDVNEFLMSPFRWCDVGYITVRVTNNHATNSYNIYGHVRGVNLG